MPKKKRKIDPSRLDRFRQPASAVTFTGKTADGKPVRRVKAKKEGEEALAAKAESKAKAGSRLLQSLEKIELRQTGAGEKRDEEVGAEEA